MGETTATLKYKGRTVEMNDENVAAAMKLGNEPVQLNLTFGRVYSDLALKETIRGVKAIARELIRLGFDKESVTEILILLGGGKPIIVSAIDAIDDALADD